MHKSTLAAGAAFSFLAVAIGAFGAHGLHDILVSNQRLDTFETGVQYHMMHALALLAVGLTTIKKPSKLLTYSAWLFSIGILIFSGSLYLLAILNVPMLGAITPIGGLAFLAGWVVYFIVILKE